MDDMLGEEVVRLVDVWNIQHLILFSVGVLKDMQAVMIW